jgi:ferredoxin-NADP reductase
VTEWPLCRGRVTDCLKVHTLSTKKTGYYLCGSKQMIEDTKKTLTTQGVEEKNIHHEKFY